MHRVLAAITLAVAAALVTVGIALGSASTARPAATRVGRLQVPAQLRAEAVRSIATAHAHPVPNVTVPNSGATTCYVGEASCSLHPCTEFVAPAVYALGPQVVNGQPAPRPQCARAGAAVAVTRPVVLVSPR